MTDSSAPAEPSPSPASVEVAEPAPPPPPLVSPALTHSLELDFSIATNRLIERLIDKRPKLTFDARRALERMAKARCVEILKRAAVDCSNAINEVTPPPP